MLSASNYGTSEEMARITLLWQSSGPVELIPLYDVGYMCWCRRWNAGCAEAGKLEMDCVPGTTNVRSIGKELSDVLSAEDLSKAGGRRMARRSLDMQ